MGVCRLQVVLHRDARGIPQPARHHVDREAFGKFRFTSRSTVLERLLPGRQTGSLDDPVELRTKIGIRTPVASDDELCSFSCLIKRSFQVNSYFREQWNRSQAPSLDSALAGGSWSSQHSPT